LYLHKLIRHLTEIDWIGSYVCAIYAINTRLLTSAASDKEILIHWQESCTF